MNHRLFVYGTLRQGQPNHRVLRDAPLVGEAALYGPWEMLDLGAFPAVVPAEALSRIAGEVYLIDTFEFVDRLEGHPHMYRRFPLTLVDQSEAWVYIYQAHRGPWPAIAGGDWVCRR